MNEWSRVTGWELVLPPNRPSVVQVEIVTRWLSHTPRGAPVAVLGSTPEFRDMLAREGFNDVVVFERSIEFYAATERMLLHADPALESLIVGDWLDTIPAHRNAFGAVLSDLTLGNLPHELQPQFIADVAEAMMDGGVLVDRVLVHPWFKPIHQVVDAYSAKPLNLVTINEFNADALFTSELIAQEALVDSTVLLDHLNSSRFPSFIKRLALEVEKVTPRGMRWYYGKRAHLPEYGQLGLCTLAVNEEPESSPYYGFAKLVLLRKQRRRSVGQGATPGRGEER